MKLMYFIAPLPYTVLQIQWYLWKILLTHINSVSSQGSLWKFHTGLCCALITPTLPSPSSSAFLLPQRFPSHPTTVPLPFSGLLLLSFYVLCMRKNMMLVFLSWFILYNLMSHSSICFPMNDILSCFSIATTPLCIYSTFSISAHLPMGT